MSSESPFQSLGQGGVTLRPATLDDIPAALRLMDIAVDWLVKRGQPGQWGTEKPSEDPARVEHATQFVESGGTWIAVDNTASPKSGESGEELSIINSVVGVLTVGKANPYVEPATDPELYINFLITDRASSGKSIGTLLLDKARGLAREAGVSLLRVDCYAGGSGGLVRYYESQGFEKTDAFEIKDWPGQILIQRLNIGNKSGG
ncbi:hypothetical protein BT63DRAFT_476689 [Microthyrium microscopicum]|uniref:N-acetyltransferase domain-containing protein n=1 Tax=Microthyrium microscopicum TaxID=703497 RepID=A0A6A6UJY7_9PEZI|nr:hypothetical protein BT63DRAFT_476689 [Microthyrium microscopicum]